MLPFEKKTIRLYKFYFVGILDPMIIEAENKKAALEYLKAEVSARPQLHSLELEDIKVITPVYGLTTQGEGDAKCIWVGFEESMSGWVLEKDFKDLNK